MYSAASVYLVIATFNVCYCKDYNHQMCAISEGGKYFGTISKNGEIVGEGGKEATYAPFQVHLVYFDVKAKEMKGRTLIRDFNLHLGSLQHLFVEGR